MHFNAVPLTDRFFSKMKVDVSGCWNWTAAKVRNGYGVIKVGKKMKKAHRVSYELKRGPIPEGILVCHSCDNPSCINPDHLFLGTSVDNAADRDAKGRHRHMLTDAEVAAIRVAKGISRRKLALSYGVSYTHVANILSGTRR